ncbi:DUF3024 domain-containing protein [Vibrio intestinalis]|uniref:DUF3024 domain-containing protein n=1 Tax=Vibrio intestinalis TaxID=2933291 RepID=UPI0021A744BE|nr:DUF3024 domain-containing protein [Vibrio intestinalis]
MGLVSLLQKQVEHRALFVCQHRNQGLPPEMGKANFEPVENGVIFIKQHYLLDSNHCDYMRSVAKIVWDHDEETWLLLITDDEANESWKPYPYLTKSGDLTAIMREVEKDPKEIFWS